MRFEALAEQLEVLASAARLELLHALRTPSPLHEIRLAAHEPRAGMARGRPLSRQAVAHHLDQLVEFDLVRRVVGVPGGGYVLNHERLFALVDELRSLAKLRPLAPGMMQPGATIQAGRDASTLSVAAPRLVVAYGRDDGAAFGLRDVRRLEIGRAAGCDLRLDYDPFVSNRHCSIERGPDGFHIVDASRNGTWVNGARLGPGGRQRLRSGDLLGIGRSLLVFQDV